MTIKLSKKYRGCPMFDDVPLTFREVRAFCELGCVSSCPQILMGYFNNHCRDKERLLDYARKLEERLEVSDMRGGDSRGKKEEKARRRLLVSCFVYKFS